MKRVKNVIKNMDARGTATFGRTMNGTMVASVAQKYFPIINKHLRKFMPL